MHEPILTPMTFQPPSRPEPDPAARLAPRLTELRSQLAGSNPASLAARTGSEFVSTEFHLLLWGKPVVLQWPNLIALDAATRQVLRPDQQALVLFYFTSADGTPESGQWISFADLPDGRFYNQAFQGYTGQALARAFGSDQTAFERAAIRLDGRPYPLGDAGFMIRALPFVSLLVTYWQGDDDFPPSCQILFDSTIHRYLPTEACAILGSILTRRLIAARNTSEPKG
jgi:hypothetical protein